MSDSADSPESLPDAAELAILTEPSRGSASRKRLSTTGPPRLGTVHFLLWTASCAVFLGITRSIAPRPAGLTGAAVLVLVAAGEGAAWAGLTITLARLVLGKPWPIEPGQWLLAIIGTVNIIELFVLAASRHGMHNQQGMVLVLTACAFLLPLFTRRLPRLWRWLFGALSLLYATPLIISVLASQFDLPRMLTGAGSQLTFKRLNELTALAALVSAFIDRDRKERTWLHWSGIVTALWLAALSLLA